jgi:hypothetical protein
MAAAQFPAVSLSGGVLSPDLLERIRDGDRDIPGIDPQSYGLTSGESVRRYANGRFSYLRDTFTEMAGRRNGARRGRVSQRSWQTLLLRELRYEDPELRPWDGLGDAERAASHSWRRTVPVHLVGWDSEIDWVKGRRGRGRPPVATVQRLLNDGDGRLWGLVSNGRRLRLLRNSTSLISAAYVDFDVEMIFEGDLFADFMVLFRMAHSSRLVVRDEATGPASCLLEEWRSFSAKEGERALSKLRTGVEAALDTLADGFVRHPANQRLRDALGTSLSPLDFKRSLLRAVYKLIFWMVIEDRDVLLDPEADAAARARYETYLSSQRIRRLADVRRYSRHSDLWESVKLVFGILGSERGLPMLGLPGLGGVFEPSALDDPLKDARLVNECLLRAVHQLNVLPGRSNGRIHRVSWSRMAAEEIGSLYEALLELHPRWDPTTRSFWFERVKGSARKKSGAYYTPPALIDQLLDSALEPLLDEACAAPTPAKRIAALEKITVCDPACGSGSFLVGAARRIAKRIAIERTDESEPSQAAVQEALRLVVGRCIYGLDVNELSVELARISLWLEAMEPGKPLGYLEGHIKVGDALLGVTPALLDNLRVPDTAYAALAGDDRQIVTALRRQNTQERSGQGVLTDPLDLSNLDLADAAQAVAHLAPCESLADVHVQAERDRALDPAKAKRRLAADAWCAAFVAPKTKDTRPYALTNAMIKRVSKEEDADEVRAARYLVDEAHRHYRFFHWHIEFPHIFRVPERGKNGVDPATGWRGGFSCVLTNPPWERVKLQEQEFFAARSAAIAQAPNAAARKRMIAALQGSPVPEERRLHQEWVTELRGAEGRSHLLRKLGRHPLTGTGDINTYSVFAETCRLLSAPSGTVGMITPTGIATDATTQRFFKDLVTNRSLVSLHDFENEERVFPDVHHSTRFCLLVMNGKGREADSASLVFRVRRPQQIAARAYSLTPEEITLLNPNTGTCPVFLTRRDAEITLDIYRRIPVLWREDDPNGNPWGVSFMAMLHMANDSGLFRTADELVEEGWKRAGNRFGRGRERMLPLYEAKMAHFFDHRLGTYEGATEAQLNVGMLPRLSDADHTDPSRLPLPRYWVAELEVDKVVGNRELQGFLIWRRIARSTDERTMICCSLPKAAVGDSAFIALLDRPRPELLANISGFVVDYVLRNKMAGTNVSYYLFKQLPVLPPDRYEEAPAWDADCGSLNAWVTARVLELSYTAYDLAAYARDLGDHGPSFRWDPARREIMRAELDAAYFHLYGIGREDVDYIMDTFPTVRQRDEVGYGDYRTKRLILERYDALAASIASDTPYRSPLDPPSGSGPRHPAVRVRR